MPYIDLTRIEFRIVSYLVIACFIEVKKSTSTVSEDYDIEKLKHYTDPTNNLNYTYGAFIKFNTAKARYQSPEIRYFSNGDEVHREITTQGNGRR